MYIMTPINATSSSYPQAQTTPNVSLPFCGLKRLISEQSASVDLNKTASDPGPLDRIYTDILCHCAAPHPTAGTLRLSIPVVARRERLLDRIEMGHAGTRNLRSGVVALAAEKVQLRESELGHHPTDLVRDLAKTGNAPMKQGATWSGTYTLIIESSFSIEEVEELSILDATEPI